MQHTLCFVVCAFLVGLQCMLFHTGEQVGACHPVYWFFGVVSRCWDAGRGPRARTFPRAAVSRAVPVVLQPSCRRPCLCPPPANRPCPCARCLQGARFAGKCIKDLRSLGE